MFSRTQESREAGAERRGLNQKASNVGLERLDLDSSPERIFSKATGRNLMYGLVL